jgi:hypothetical protein
MTSSRTIYQLMLHIPTGERYAFQIEMPGYHVTGCRGPQALLQWRSTDLIQLDYEGSTGLVPWANEHLAEFELTG